MTRITRWLAAVSAAAACLAAGLVAVPGASADLPTPRTPRPTVINPVPTPSLAPITVLSVGDSLTRGTDGSTYASYRGELTRLMSMTGQAHTWVVDAEGGKKCSYWATGRMAWLLTTYRPDVVFLDCGTNDTPSDATESDVRTILAAVASYNAASARDALLVAALIGQPDMDSDTNVVRPWIWDWMHNTSQAIGRALAAYPAVPVADMVRVPNNIEWLDPDGIHLTARSNAAYAELFYRAAQQLVGWLTLAQMHLSGMCGLHGHWRGTPWPTGYRVCLN